MAALTLLVFALPAAAFEHPGGLHTKAQIEFVRKQAKAAKQPWKCGYDQLLGKECPVRLVRRKEGAQQPGQLVPPCGAGRGPPDG